MEKTTITLVLIIIVFASASFGETLVFKTSDNPFTPGVKNQGWWSDTISTYNENDNYAIGINPNENITRNFFTFDLSSLSGIVKSAILEIRRYEYYSTAESEILGLFDVSTDATTLNNNVGPNADIYNDLGSGISYGEFEVFVTGLETDVLSFELNSAAIADINTAKGEWFSIGGAILSFGSPVSDGSEIIFGRSHGVGVQRLVLEVVPEPISLLLLGAGGIVLLRKRK